MGLKKAESQVRIMLADTIMAVCRSTLNYHGEVSVEGLLGVTLDKEEIFLVSINQTITNPDVLQVRSNSGTQEHDKQKDRKRRSSVDESSESESCSESQSEAEDNVENNMENNTEIRQKRRRKRRKRKTSHSSENTHDSSDSEPDHSKNSQHHSSEVHVYNVDETSHTSAISASIPDIAQTPIKREESDDELMIIKEEGFDSNSAMEQHYSDFVAATGSHFPPFNQFNLPPNDNMQFLASQQQMPPDGSIAQPGPSNPDAYKLAASRYYEEPARPTRLTVKSRSEGSPRVTPICKVCGKQFAYPCLLQRHLLVHTRDKPHICSYCGTRFTQKCTLTAHYRNCKMKIENVKVIKPEVMEWPETEKPSPP